MTCRQLRTPKELHPIDIGSFDVNGSYKLLLNRPGWHYQGVDQSPGKNVDVVLTSPYEFPLPDTSADVVISGQTFEHVEYFWVTWLEIVRILKPGGLVFLIAPSRGPEHRYPVDCWRFYPDGYRALAKLAGMTILEVSTDWTPHPDPGSAAWGDTVGVFEKPKHHQALEAPIDRTYTDLTTKSNNDTATLVGFIEQLTVGINALLGSTRWKAGNALGEVRRVALRRPRTPTPPDHLKRVLHRFANWRDSKESHDLKSQHTLSSFIRSFADVWRQRGERKTSEDYFLWYYNSGIWNHLHWLGVPCLKSVSDMWNYQEIISELKPGLIVEFGTRYGGSALFFAHILHGLGHKAKVLTVDIETRGIRKRTRDEVLVEIMTGSSVRPKVKARIVELRAEYPGPVFAILDSDHRKEHVLAEMEMLRDVLVSGDYLIVEDGVVNGHPILPNHGAGPLEAIQEYETKHGSDFRHDVEREAKFGFTLAPHGFLIRR